MEQCQNSKPGLLAFRVASYGITGAMILGGRGVTSYFSFSCHWQAVSSTLYIYILLHFYHLLLSSISFRIYFRNKKKYTPFEIYGSYHN